jgi:hypothetical protein
LGLTGYFALADGAFVPPLGGGGKGGGVFVPPLGGGGGKCGGALVPITGGAFVPITGGGLFVPSPGGGGGGGQLVPPKGGGALVQMTGGVLVPAEVDFPELELGRGVTASTVAAQTVMPTRMNSADFLSRFIRSALVEVV